jgi:hypothetical protein
MLENSNNTCCEIQWMASGGASLVVSCQICFCAAVVAAEYRTTQPFETSLGLSN